MTAFLSDLGIVLIDPRWGYLGGPAVVAEALAAAGLADAVQAPCEGGQVWPAWGAAPWSSAGEDLRALTARVFDARSALDRELRRRGWCVGPSLVLTPLFLSDDGRSVSLEGPLWCATPAGQEELRCMYPGPGAAWALLAWGRGLPCREACHPENDRDRVRALLHCGWIIVST